MATFTISKQDCDRIILTQGTGNLDDIVGITTYLNCCEKNVYSFTPITAELARCDEPGVGEVKFDIQINTTLTLTGSSVTTTNGVLSATSPAAHNKRILQMNIGNNATVVFTITDSNGNDIVITITITNVEDCEVGPSIDSYTVSYPSDSTEFCGIETATFGEDVTLSFLPCAFETSCTTCTSDTLTHGIYSIELTYAEDSERFCLFSDCDSFYCKVINSALSCPEDMSYIIRMYYALLGISSALNSDNPSLANCSDYIDCDVLCDAYRLLYTKVLNCTGNSSSTTSTDCGC